MAKLSDAMKGGKHTTTQETTPPVPEAEKLPYNPREFLVPATNKSRTPPAKLWFKLQAGHEHEIAKIIAQRMFPYYETPSDLCRHAIDRQLKWLHTCGAPVTQEWLQTEAIIELVKEQMRQHDFDTYLKDLEATVTKSIEMGMRGEAKLLVNKIRIIVVQMATGRWRDRWVRELKTRFAHLDSTEDVT